MKRTAILFSLVLLLVSCKASVEGETKRWKRNKQTVAELTALYPGFKSPLAQQLKSATALMDKAKKVSDAEQSAKAMSRANSALGGGFVGKLKGADSKKKRVRDKIVTATTKAKDKTDRLAAKQVAKDARQVLKEVDRRLKKGASTASAAGIVLRKVDSDLDDVIRRLDKVISSAKKKQQVKKGKKGKKGKSGKGDEPAGKSKPAAAGKWKCAYCDQMHDNKVKKCTNCGAAR